MISYAVEIRDRAGSYVDSFYGFLGHDARNAAVVLIGKSMLRAHGETLWDGWWW